MPRAGTIALGVVLGAAALAIMLAPRPHAPAASTWRPSHTLVAGAFHVHTNRSPDSSGTIDEAVAAARKAGLRFVIATEHGDGTRPPLPPAYHSGVLWIDGVEISTSDGHYATFGMSQAPYPLAGDARDVAEDVARLGGTGVAAHGDSAKSEAQWRDWNAPIDGLEWLNLDSVWRDAGVARLARAALTYWFHPSATLASLGSRPDQTLAHLDTLAEKRHVITLAATDAHGRAIPSYAACFGAFSTIVELSAPLTGDATADAAALMASLRAGHSYTAIDALAQPSAFAFTASAAGRQATEGDLLPAGDPITFDIHVTAQAGANTVLLRNGVAVQESRAASWRHQTDGNPAEYRVEVTLPDSPGRPPLPWILSNPIFVGIPAVADRPAETPRTPVAAVPPFAWHEEKSSSSTASLSSSSGLALRYSLGGGAPSNQFVAAVAGAPSNLADAQGISFTVRASRPMRCSLELRATGDRRWERSLYADGTPRHVSIAFSAMRPVQPTTEQTPPLSAVDSVLFLVGVTQTAPGTSGDVTFSDLTLERFQDR
jgi:hypothetical protein